MGDAKRRADLGFDSKNTSKYNSYNAIPSMISSENYPNTKLSTAELKNPLVNGYFKVIFIDDNNPTEYFLNVVLHGKDRLTYSEAIGVTLIVFCDDDLNLFKTYRGYLSDHPSRDPMNIKFIKTGEVC